MNFKNFQYLAVIGLGFFLSNSIKPVQASQLKTENQEVKSSEVLFSQLRGHDLYMGEPQIEWGGNMLGRVVGKSGGIMFITVEDGGNFQANGGFCPGSDVLVGKNENGGYYLVDKGHSQWISVLESKYGYKRVASTSSALSERTKAIWASLETSSKMTTTEIAPRPVTPPPTYTPQAPVPEYNQPIRGLW